jgi:hypothetical protein
MNDQLQQALAQALNAIQQAAQQHGPAAAELALWVAWTGAFSRVVGSALLLAVGLASMLICYRLGRFGVRKLADTKNDEWGWLAYCSGIGAIVSLFCIVAGFVRLLNAYAWVGLWRPEVFLAARLLGWIE